ncbi:MAG TPA: N-acetylmuramoyl-L-alanine amidase [bacterium]|nr:N-acetylmuramoyl-L-alanine amidase [bacterium]
MKQAWTALAVASILALSVSSSVFAVPAQSGRPRVIVNETPVSFSTPPALDRGVLVAPLAPLARAFGATVAWEHDARAGTVTSRAGTVVRLTVGDPTALVAGSQVTLPVSPARRSGAVWVPVAAFLRTLGAYVRVSGDADIIEAVSQVTGMTWHRGTDGLVVRVHATGPVQTQVSVLTDPDRLVVDILSAVDSLKDARMEVGDPDVVAVRAAQFSVRPDVTRVVLDLIRPVPYAVAVDGEGVAVTVSGTATAGNALPRDTNPAPTGPPEAPNQGPAVREPEHSSGAAAPEPRAAPSLPEFVDTPGAFHIRAVDYRIAEGTGRLTILASQPVAPVVRQFTYPDRLAVDLPGGLFLPRREDLEIGSDAVRNIVVAQLQVQPNLTRVLVYFHRRTSVTTTSTDGGRTLTIALSDIARAAKRPPAVVIDPGHGGPDSGAIGPTGVREADVTLEIGHMVRQALEHQHVRVVLTRTTNALVGLEDRPDIARREGGVVFVSIHANASQYSSKKGTETYYATPESASLAAVIQSEVVQALGEPDRGVRAADFYVIVNSPMPAVLLETAFISNPAEERLLRSPATQRRIAEAIARAIVRYLGARTAAPAP